MPVLDAIFRQEFQTQNGRKWQKKGGLDAHHHWACAKVRNITRSFLWGILRTTAIHTSLLRPGERFQAALMAEATGALSCLRPTHHQGNGLAQSSYPMACLWRQ